MLIWNGNEWQQFSGAAARDTKRGDAAKARIASGTERLKAHRWLGMLHQFLADPNTRYLRPSDRMEMDAIRFYQS